MSQHHQVDLAILGGGCAGLSLARELSLNKSWNRKTLIIEPRKIYLNDRSWCFWEPHEFALKKALEPIIQHSWQQWRFSGADFSLIHSSNGRRYCHVAADDFYKQAVSSIATNENIELRMGQSVKNVEKIKAGYLISLDDGSSLHASQVIDTRTSNYHHSNQAQLWQIFYGYEIETIDDLFDDTTVGLMENLTGHSTSTQFLYVLPFSKRRALFELTQFSKELFAPEKLAYSLNEFLQNTFGKHNFKILRTEYACLPMGLKSEAKSKSSDYYYAGTVAGAIRPATGYAFIRIQQWAHQCARELFEGTRLSKLKQSTPLIRAMDRIFLNVIRDTPALGAVFYQALAECVSGKSLVRFLMDEAKIKDIIQITKALPKFRFLIYSLGLNQFFYQRMENS
jgi:lycopene beta-cyclase